MASGMISRKRKKEPAMQPGYDGAVTFDVGVRVSGSRKVARSIRAMPGTFEWRYGRATGDAALYHAGTHFAGLWERAGTASAQSIDWGATPGGEWKGLPDGRAVAMAQLRGVMNKLGPKQATRLIAYCVKGWTVSQVAAVERSPQRDIAAVLHHDLKEVAGFFQFTGR